MAVMTARQASAPAVEVPAGERGGTKPGGHEQLWSTVVGLGIPAASFLLAWGLHGSTASTYRIDSQWSALTGLFVLALAIERALEPFSRKLGPDTTKRKDARDRPLAGPPAYDMEDKAVTCQSAVEMSRRLTGGRHLGCGDWPCFSFCAPS